MVIEEHARLEITLPDGRQFEISENDIIKDSLSLTSQCVNGNTFGFGCVSPAQLSVKFRLKSQNIGRYDVYGAKIILYSYFGNVLPDDDGKKGVFNVTSVTKNNDIFTVSASDNVCWLDNSAFGGEENEYSNKVYKRLNKEVLSAWNARDLFSIIVEDVAGEVAQEMSGLELKAVYANDLTHERIPNASAKFTGYGIPQDGQEEHHERHVVLLNGEQSDNIRDYVAWITEYMGGFAVADQNGNIEFKLFESPYYYKNPEILNFSEFQQNTLEIAGFRVFLYSAKMIAEDNYCNSFWFGKSSEKSVINVETEIKNNPFVEFCYEYYVKKNNGSLYNLAVPLEYYQHWIQIRPFSGTYHGNKYLHLGQYIKIRDENGTEHETTITNITWKFRGGQQIKCVGEDSRTLSQARKRTQAVRMGERMKTQINRLRERLENGG